VAAGVLGWSSEGSDEVAGRGATKADRRNESDERAASTASVMKLNKYSNSARKHKLPRLEH
jgi:hypothetical protein